MDCCQGKSHEGHIVDLLDSRIPKTDSEWAAKREIERLQAENEQLRARVKRLEEEDKKSLGLLWERHHD